MKGIAIIAYFIDLTGTFFGQVGYLLMKQALLKAEDYAIKNPEKKVRSPYLSYRYLSGFILLGLSSMIHGAVLPFADLVLLSTITAAGIVFSTLLSVKFLKEKFICKYDLPSFTLIIIGCTIIVALSNQEETEYSPERIKKLLKSTQYVVFIIVYFTLAISTAFIWNWVMTHVIRFNQKSNDWMVALLKKETGQ